MNLFGSFAINCTCWLVFYGIVVPNSDSIISPNPVSLFQPVAPDNDGDEKLPRPRPSGWQEKTRGVAGEGGGDDTVAATHSAIHLAGQAAGHIKHEVGLGRSEEWHTTLKACPCRRRRSPCPPEPQGRLVAARQDGDADGMSV